LPQQSKPLLARENIIIPASFTRKEQVIQYLCGNLAIQGRTNNPQALEEDIWQREEIVTTAVGVWRGNPAHQIDTYSALQHQHCPLAAAY